MVGPMCRHAAPNRSFVDARARLVRAVRRPMLATLWLAATGCAVIGPAPTPTPDGTAVPALQPPPETAPQAQAQTPSASVPAPATAAPVRRRARAPRDAVPRVERLAKGHPNRVYRIRGQDYAPEHTDVAISEVGIASWYGRPFHGRATSTGERYDMNRMTAAHKTMPLPSYARVRNLSNGREVIVRVNDRGPFYSGRVIDLSRAAARKLRITGLARVRVDRLTHAEIRSGAWRQPRSRALAARPTKPRAAREQRTAAPATVASAND